VRWNVALQPCLSHASQSPLFTDGFMGGYYGIRKFLTTPVPFPLIQMARGFVFLYVFTIPFVMLGDQSGLLAHCFEVFLITYGFVGLELTSVALDQPFGDDEIDFDNNALACTAYEDTYLTILDVDGQEWTDKLRMKMHGDENDVAFPSEQSFLLDKVV
jgi:predicted membrane chloride channel (bestrophin family)